MRGTPPLRLIVDACLTPAVVSRLAEAFKGTVDAVHADRVLPLGSSDVTVLDWAITQSRIVVTANGADFVALARGRPGHPGLGLVTDQDTRVRQIRSVERLIRALLARRDARRPLAGHVFTWTRADRLAVRRLP